MQVLLSFTAFKTISLVCLIVLTMICHRGIFFSGLVCLVLYCFLFLYGCIFSYFVDILFCNLAEVLVYVIDLGFFSPICSYNLKVGSFYVSQSSCMFLDSCSNSFHIFCLFHPELSNIRTSAWLILLLSLSSEFPSWVIGIFQLHLHFSLNPLQCSYILIKFCLQILDYHHHFHQPTFVFSWTSLRCSFSLNSSSLKFIMLFVSSLKSLTSLM